MSFSTWLSHLVTGVRPQSLNLKLAVTAFLALVVVSAVSLVVNQVDLRNSMRLDLEMDAQRSAAEVAIVAGPILWNIDNDALWTLLESKGTDFDVVRISIIDTESQLFFGLARTLDGGLRRIFKPDQVVAGWPVQVHVERPIKYGTVEIGRVTVESSMNQREKELSQNMRSYVFTQIGLSACAVFAIMVVSQRIVRRIHELELVMAAFSQNNLEVRAGIGTTDEIGALAAGFNTMANRIRDYAQNMEVLVQERTNRLIESEKLAFLGSLVAGVAHELNTPIGNCMTISSWMSDRNRSLATLSESGELTKSAFDRFLEDTAETFRILETNLARASELIRAFKQVGADQMFDEVRTFLLSQNLQEMVTSLQPSFRKAGHQVTIDCPENLVLNTSPGAVYQVCSNLVMNAVLHAFPAETIGEITIRARLEQRGKEAEPWVHIDVIDNGVGISPRDQEQIFLPFFTTKRNAGGTGLGLSIVHSICTNLGGEIRCQSVVGEGATFLVSLPPQLLAPRSKDS